MYQTELGMSPSKKTSITVTLFSFSFSMSNNTWSTVKYLNNVKLIRAEMVPLLECVSMDE